MTTFVERHFTAAGWYLGRSVPVTTVAPVGHPAMAVLREFGGLKVGGNGAGEECASSMVDFCSIERDSEIVQWEGLLSSLLVGVAEVCSGHGELYLAADGRCFGRSCVHDAFYFEGPTFFEAIERILRGQRARPMLRPNQELTSLYGILYGRGDSALYDY